MEIDSHIATRNRDTVPVELFKQTIPGDLIKREVENVPDVLFLDFFGRGNDPVVVGLLQSDLTRFLAVVETLAAQNRESIGCGSHRRRVEQGAIDVDRFGYDTIGAATVNDDFGHLILGIVAV